MKTKISAITVCIITVCILATFQSTAQPQRPGVKPANGYQIAGGSLPASYSYKIFEAPNKMYGYDIYKNNKFLFHQPASIITADNSLAVLAKKEQAEKAVLLAIEKIKKGQPATLTQEEIKKTITQ